MEGEASESVLLIDNNQEMESQHNRQAPPSKTCFHYCVGLLSSLYLGAKEVKSSELRAVLVHTYSPL